MPGSSLHARQTPAGSLFVLTVWLSVAVSVMATVILAGAYGAARTFGGRRFRTRRRSADGLVSTPPQAERDDLVCRFLPDTTLTFVNEAYCQFWGRSRDELLGRSFLDLIPDDSREAVRERIGRVAVEVDSHEHQVIRAMARSAGSDGRTRRSWMRRAG